MGSKQIIFVHGRSFKPSEDIMCNNWIEAIRISLRRDHEKVLDKFEELIGNDCVKMAYYGDSSNRFLRANGKHYDEELDIEDRQETLRDLSKLGGDELQSRNHYESLPGRSGIVESLADILHKPVEWIRLADNLIGRFAPDVQEYWSGDSQFGSDARWPLTRLLESALVDDKDICLVAHSLGSVISYDVLWKFSHYGEYRHIRTSRGVSVWLTMGSPLGNPTVQKYLKGSSAEGHRRYPHLIRKWANVSAEDDYICHDETISDDFRKMIRMNLVDEVTDRRNFNMAVRGRRDGGVGGKSNPHHGAGYLVSPEVGDTVAEWLSEADEVPQQS